MAIALLETNSARVEFGDIAAFANLSALTLAVTVKITNATATGDRLFAQWRAGVTGVQSWLLFVDDTNELAMIINPLGTSVEHYGKKTTALNLAAGSTYRIVSKLDSPGNAGAIWVNGSAQTITARGTDTSTTTGNSTETVFIGHEAATGTDTVDGEISEVAAWAEYVPDWFCEAYGKGFAPTCYLQNLIFYAPLFNTAHLLDIKGGISGSNTGATDAAHPSMLYPRHST